MPNLERLFCTGLEIVRDRTCDLLRLSLKTHVSHVLKRFNMQNHSISEAPIVKGDKFSKSQSKESNKKRIY